MQCPICTKHHNFSKIPVLSTSKGQYSVVIIAPPVGNRILLCTNSNIRCSICFKLHIFYKSPGRKTSTCRYSVMVIGPTAGSRNSDIWALSPWCDFAATLQRLHLFKKNYAANDLITHCTMNCIINMFNIYILKQINLWDLVPSLVNWGIFLSCREVYYVIALWMQAQSTWVDMPLIHRWYATAFNINIFALFLEQYFFLHSF